MSHETHEGVMRFSIVGACLLVRLWWHAWTVTIPQYWFIKTKQLTLSSESFKVLRCSMSLTDLTLSCRAMSINIKKTQSERYRAWASDRRRKQERGGTYTLKKCMKLYVFEGVSVWRPPQWHRPLTYDLVRVLQQLRKEKDLGFRHECRNHENCVKKKMATKGTEFV